MELAMEHSKELIDAAMTLIMAEDFFERLRFANIPTTIEERAIAKIQYDKANMKLQLCYYNYHKLLTKE
jgi:hypothetical protein